MHKLDPLIFPILQEASCISLNKVKENAETSPKKIKLESTSIAQNSNINFDQNKVSLISVSTLTSFHLRPMKGLDCMTEPILIPTDYLKELEAIPEYLPAIKAFRSDPLAIKHNNCKDSRINSYPKILFLGTGSCIPNKTRNVSAILIHVSEEAYFLMDCGEGTTSQIYRFYGDEKGREVISKLKGIYVSHLHADHHLGESFY